MTLVMSPRWGGCGRVRALFEGLLLGGLVLGSLTACGGSSLTLDSGDPGQGGSANPAPPGGQAPGGQDTGDTDPGGGQDTGFWPMDSGITQSPGQQPGQNPGGQNPGQQPAQDSGMPFGQDSGMSFGQDSGMSFGQDSGCNTGQPGGQSPGGQGPGGQSPGGCTQTLEPGVPGVLDCDGTCAPQTWIGDGVCDDGTYGANLQCAQHQQDGGDC